MRLDQITAALLPWTQDPWGALRPPLSVELLQMSARLAGDTYAMAVDEWLQAGWRDATIQVDGELTQLNPQESWLQGQWKRLRVRSKIRQRNPVSQLLGALRQVDSSRTGKALVMIHPAPEGRYVVAVSFMGTGTRFYDWISNFRMSTQEGVHKGFLQLTRQFEANECAIEFPETAKELGLERLTLQQILGEMRHPNSRFVLWLSGHSQGGALMQIYAHNKIHEDGVLPNHIVGYGFASPSVMTGEAVPNPAAYPLYQIHNSDDLFPRCGAEVHLGVCLTYLADAALRKHCYAWPMDGTSILCRQALQPLLRRMEDTASCIECVAAYLNVLSRCDAADILAALGLKDHLLPLRQVVAAADVDSLVRSVNRHAAAAYQSLTGKPLDQVRIAEIMADMEDIKDRIGIRAFGAALVQVIRYPHSMVRSFPGGFVGAYWFIAAHGIDRLIPSVWISGQTPVRMTAATQTGRLDGEEPEELIVRHIMQRPRRIHRNIRYRDPRSHTDTRHVTPELQMGALLAGEKAVRIRDDK